ncbi:FxSxx-COOH system tetratricopeptide repeat protein [Nonomuraea angiospora]|uniref:FxSxx-COOH system tetratricopeptide repeat protein n=1 Tax=Nonomuraea angiospora TaxID=46172 RepID=UPI00341EDB1F
MTGSKEQGPGRARLRPRALIWIVVVVSLVLLAAGLVGFFADPLHLPAEVLDVLDKRASVISMFVGIAGLLVTGAALWAQLRSPASSPTSTVSSSGPSSPATGGSVSGGLVGQITGGFVGSVGGVHLPPRPPVNARPVRLAPRPPWLAGRDHTLAEVHARLTASPEQPCLLAIHGLGGVGKTSLAVEYGHRYQHEYELVWQLPAEDSAVLSAALADLAAMLGMRQPGETADPVHQVHAVLAAHPGRWLLIFDNAPDADAARTFLPPAGNGHVLVTSRSANWPTRHGLELPVLDGDPAAAFLLERSGQDDTAAAAAVVTELGALPLALEQAGAYIAGTGTTLAGYLHLLRRQRTELLDQGHPWGYSERVASTWRLAFDHLDETTPQAIALLQLLACYAPEAIPYQLLLAPLDHSNPRNMLDGGDHGIAELLALPHGDLAINAAIEALRRYSLINRPSDGSVSVHRLVQAVTLDQLNPSQRAAWQHAATALLEAALPDTPEQPDTWPRFAQLLPHARTVLPLTSPILRTVAQYLGQSGDYRTATTLTREIHHALEASLGAEHPDTLVARDDLAIWTGEAGDAAAARDQLTTLLSINEHVLGAEHPQTLFHRDVLAYWTGEAGDAAAARDQLTTLLSINEHVLGAEHPDTLHVRQHQVYWANRASRGR